eukprot:7382142-Prymnesium_polylepis.1
MKLPGGEPITTLERDSVGGLDAETASVLRPHTHRLVPIAASLVALDSNVSGSVLQTALPRDS